MKKTIAAILFIVSIFEAKAVYSQWIKHYVETQLPNAMLVTISDIDDDNDVDILVSAAQDGIILYEAPSWEKHIIDSNSGATKVGDINSDNKLDIIATNFSANQVVWYEAPQWTSHLINDNLQGAAGLIATDLDSDTDIDVIATGYEAQKVVCYEAPNWTVTIIDTNLAGAQLIRSADLDSDGDTDIVVGAELAGLLMWYEAPSWISHVIDEQQPNVWGLDLGDIDGDSDIDVVVGGVDNNDVVWWYENPNWIKHSVDSLSIAVSSIFIADIDNDSNLDIVTSGHGGVVWYKSPLWSKYVIDDSATGAPGLYAGDIDYDNDKDVIACDMAVGHVVIYESTITSVASDNELINVPEEFILLQNFPNPFNTNTTFRYGIPKSLHVKIDIYDVSGRKVISLVDEQQAAGWYDLYWSGVNKEGHSVGSGVYLMLMQTDDYANAKKILLLK